VVFHAQGVTNIYFVSTVRLQSLNLAQTRELWYFVVLLSVLKGQVLLVKLFRDAPKLFQKRLHVEDLLLLNIRTLQNLEGRAEIVGRGPWHGS